MTNRKMEDLKPGAIIIQRFGGLFNKTTFGQRMIHLYTKNARAGSTKATHAMLVIKGINCAHAHPKGIGKENLAMVNDDLFEKMSVYECSATKFPANVAKVAQRWIINRNDPKDYKNRKAVRTIFGHHWFGPKAKKRAKLYHENANTTGGPPGLHSNTDNEYKKRMVCSTFVIACWQAAIGPMESLKYMALDANHSSPMTLEGYLRNNSNWTEYGIDPPERNPDSLDLESLFNKK